MNDCTSLQDICKYYVNPVQAGTILPSNFGDEGCPWLDRFVDFCNKWSPRSFYGYHEAVGLFVLSTAALGRVSYHFGRARTTNLYLALVGRTGLHAKSTDAEIGVSLLKACGMGNHLLPDTTTPQKMISLMSSRLPEDFHQMSLDRREKVLSALAFCGQRGWYYDEFGNHLSEIMRPSGCNAEFRDILRRLDNSPDLYSNGTILRGNEMIERPYLTLLASLTNTDIAPFIRKGATLWGDGYLARFSFFCPLDDDYTNDPFPIGERKFPDDLISPIKAWHQRLGFPQVGDIREGDYSVPPPPLEILEIGKDTLEAYYRYDNALRDITATFENEDLDGNYLRFSEKSLRIAALFASLENGRVIQLKHLAKAQGIAERTRAYLHCMYQNAGGENGTIDDLDERVMSCIKDHDGVTKREVQQYVHIKATVAELSINRLIDRGSVREEAAGKTVKYYHDPNGWRKKKGYYDDSRQDLFIPPEPSHPHYM